MKKCIIIIFISLFCISVYSQERRLALVIGNADYTRRALANPENDAKSMEEALKKIGFEVQRFENLSQKEMTKAIDDFGNRLRNYDVGLFFYAGHGVQSKGFNYLIPVDARLYSESDVEYNCVRADRVLGKMEDAKNKINIVILDACRDNPFERSWTRSAQGRGLASMNAPVGSVIAFATSPGSTASDGTGENGLYTTGLLTYINDPGITAMQMFQKVTSYVLRESDGQQLPWVATSLTGDFYLVPGTGSTDNTEVLNRPDVKVSSANPERSVVVLPFKNLTGKPDQDYLVQGQNDALISELCMISQVRPLRVLSGKTASAIANTSRSIPEIADENDIDYIVEGSVLNATDSISIQLRLIQAYPEEKLVWARTYKSDLSNIYKLHNNIAGQIAGRIGIVITPEHLVILPSPQKINPETYKIYLRGMYNLKLENPESIKKGIDFLNEAISLDPADAFAYAGLASGYFEIAHGPLDPGDAMIKGEAAALQSIKLDTTFAEVYFALAQAYEYSLWKFTEAEKYFKKAISINPNDANAHYHYAWLLVLLGRENEALAEHLLARRYDPFAPEIAAQLGWLYLHTGQNEKALEEAIKSLEIRPDYSFGLWGLGDAYLALGKVDEAIATHKMLAEKYPNFMFKLGITYARTGKTNEAGEVLKQMNTLKPNPFVALGFVLLNSELNNRDESFKWMAYEPHHIWLPWVSVMDWGRNLRNDPRLDEFTRKLNLPGKQVRSQE